jgi:hypothetical protein
VALPPDVRKGSAFPYTKLNNKVFRLGRLPESRRLSAHQAAQPEQPPTAIFSHLHSGRDVLRPRAYGRRAARAPDSSHLTSGQTKHEHSKHNHRHDHVEPVSLNHEGEDRE